jgi:hypothetical protein
MPIERSNGFASPMTREKTRTTSFLFSCKDGITTPMRLAPDSSRALAHCAAASSSRFEESKVARETSPEREVGFEKTTSVPSASRNSFVCGGRMSNA